MTQQEIKEKIEALYDEIEESIGKGIFVLNPHITEIYEQIEELENQCPHDFDEIGQCKYCYYMKGEDE